MSRFLLAAAVLIAAAPAALAETPRASAGGVRVTTDDSTGVTITTVQPWTVITGSVQARPFAPPQQAAAPAMPSAPVGGGSAYGAATSFGYGAGVASTTQGGVTGATPLGTADLDGNGIANDKVIGFHNRDMAFGPRGIPGAATATVVPKR